MQTIAQDHPFAATTAHAGSRRGLWAPWDIGMGAPPPDVGTRRYMVLRNATPLTEAGEVMPSEQRARFTRLIDETTRSGVHVVTETMRPSRRGRRYRNSYDGVSTYDGPFIEHTTSEISLRTSRRRV